MFIENPSMHSLFFSPLMYTCVCVFFFLTHTHTPENRNFICGVCVCRRRERGKIYIIIIIIRMTGLTVYIVVAVCGALNLHDAARLYIYFVTSCDVIQYHCETRYTRQGT